MIQIQYTDAEGASDSELIGDISRDDEKAFTLIYNRYWRQLCLFALSKIGELEGAEEVTQNVFIDLWQKRNTHHIENLSAYLYSAVKYKCVDHLRAHLVRNRYAELTSIHDDGEELTTDELIAFNELKRVMEAGMLKLPEKTREIFRLNRLESLPVKEVSLRLCMPVRTVEYHIAHALQVMRLYLKDFMVLLVYLTIHSGYLNCNL